VTIAAIVMALVQISLMGRAKIRTELNQLRFHYSGTISDAVCRSEEDTRRINEEIGGQEQAVNDSVGVLLTAGISTEETRELHEKGLDVRYTSQVPADSAMLGWWGFVAGGYYLGSQTPQSLLKIVAPPDLTWESWLNNPDYVYPTEVSGLEKEADLVASIGTIMMMITLAFPLIWFAIFRNQYVDRRNFSCRTATMLPMIAVLLALSSWAWDLFYVCGTLTHDRGSHAYPPFHPSCMATADVKASCLLFVGGLVTTIVSWAGPARTLRFRCCGYYLVSNFIQQRVLICNCRCCGKYLCIALSSIVTLFVVSGMVITSTYDDTVFTSPQRTFVANAGLLLQVFCVVFCFCGLQRCCRKSTSETPVAPGSQQVPLIDIP
jgi:hypothetical protein